MPNSLAKNDTAKLKYAYCTHRVLTIHSSTNPFSRVNHLRGTYRILCPIPRYSQHNTNRQRALSPQELDLVNDGGTCFFCF